MRIVCKARWGWRFFCALLLVGAFLAHQAPSEPASPVPPDPESRTEYCEEVSLPELENDELTRLANEVLSARRTAPANAPLPDLDRFERERDPELLAPLAIEIGPVLGGAAKERMIALARSGDAVHREHALLALLGHADPPAVETMLSLADISQPPNVADRALDALLSITESLAGTHRDETLFRARLFADRGETAPCATALLLLAELGAEEQDRPRLERLSRHGDPRVSLAARRALIEYCRAHGESARAQEVWESIPKEYRCNVAEEQP